MKTLLKLLKIPKLYDKDANLTSNVAVNKLLSPVFLVLMFCYLFFGKGLPLLVPGHIYLGAIPLSLFSTIFYVWCSYFFQPDLDVRTNRPGMNTFPFGATVQNTALGFIISPVTVASSKIWFWFWQPYAELCTHRGISHWPILSVWFRVGYLLLNLMILKTILVLLHIPVPHLMLSLEFYLKCFFPIFDLGINETHKELAHVYWVLFCLPVFISDIAHEAIDLLDSKRKGISFCPPQIPRGKFSQLREFVQLMMKKK